MEIASPPDEKMAATKEIGRSDRLDDSLLVPMRAAHLQVYPKASSIQEFLKSSRQLTRSPPLPSLFSHFQFFKIEFLKNR